MKPGRYLYLGMGGGEGDAKACYSLGLLVAMPSILLLPLLLPLHSPLHVAALLKTVDCSVMPR